MLHPEDVDGLIGLSPAYNISSYSKAKWAPFVRPFVPWIDRGVADDAMRYEAMPTRGVVETIKAIKAMNGQLDSTHSIEIPWLLVQSLDDAVILPAANEQLWKDHAAHPDSRLIKFFSGELPEVEPRMISMSGKDLEQRVLGLSPIAIQNSPDNEHYGREGSFRNCGLTAPRDRGLVRTCQEASEVLYGLWNSKVDAETPLAISTFNPSFGKLAFELRAFAGKLTHQLDQSPVRSIRNDLLRSHHDEY